MQGIVKLRENTYVKKFIVLLSAIIFSLSLMNVIGVNAYAKSAADAFSDVQNSQGGVLGDDVKNKISGLSADAQSITLTIVMGFLIVTTLWTATKFSGAGDNPQKKSQLKTALAFQVMGIAFVASYSGLILFGLNNLNLFS